MGKTKPRQKTERQLLREQQRAIGKQIKKELFAKQKREEAVNSIRNEAILNIQNDLEKELVRVREEQLKWDAEYLVAGALMAMHNEYGWGKKRLARMAHAISKEFELAQDKRIVSLEDMRDYLLENFDIDLKGDAKVTENKK